MAESEDRIVAVPFLKNMIGDLRGLSCNDPDADFWIRGEAFPNVKSELNKGTSAWIYRNANDECVGFSSLGQISWRFEGNLRRVQLIPMLGVFSKFQGVAVVPAKYCYQIVDHILDIATQRIAISPWVGLSVRRIMPRRFTFTKKPGFNGSKPRGDRR